MATNPQSSERAQEVFSIVLYGAAALVIGGGAGIYVPLVMGKEVGVDTFATYVFAILAPAFLDALFEPYWRDLKPVHQLSIGFLCVATAALAGVSLLREHSPWSMRSVLLATILVLVVWFVMSLISGRFRRSSVPPKGSIGGADPKTSNLGGEGLPS